MAALDISDHYVLSFTQNVELLLQQQQSRLMPCVNMSSYEGESAQVIKQFGDVAFQDNLEANWKDDTSFQTIEHHQRWVTPNDYDLALPIAKEEEIRMLDSPQSPYAMAMRSAWNRRIDDTIIAAMGGNALTGNKGTTSTAFPAGQTIAAGGAGLTIAKLLEAKEILDAAENDEGEERYLVHSAKQMTDLLNTTEVTSSDYNTVKALVQGDIDTFVGFKFVRSERLPLATADRSCYAWVKSGMHMAQWNGLETHIDPRPDKKYITQVYMKGTIGATRTQEEKVVEVVCLES